MNFGTGLKGELFEEFGVEPVGGGGEQINTLATTSMVVKPLFGKLSIFNLDVIYSETFFVGGIGPLLKGEYWRPVVNLGVGLRFWSGAALSWRFEKNVIDEAAQFEEGARVIVIYRLLPGDVKRVTALAFPGVEKTPIYVNLTGERVVVRSAPRVNDACDAAGIEGATETHVPRGGRAEVLEGCWCCAVAGQTCPTTTKSGDGRAYLVQCFE